MAQIDDLRNAIAQLGTDITEQNAALSDALGRVEAKVASLGEPDPDLSADIQAIRDSSSQLDASTAQLQNLAAAPPPEGGGDTTGEGTPTPPAEGGDGGDGGNEPPPEFPTGDNEPVQ